MIHELQIIFHKLPITHYPLPITHYPLSITHYLIGKNSKRYLYKATGLLIALK